MADTFLPTHSQPAPIQPLTLAGRNLQVTLGGAPTQAGWRLRGEKSWRTSGSLSPRLYQGEHWVEFRPVPGWTAPAPAPAEITVPGATLSPNPAYVPSASSPTGTGFLRATHSPAVGGWRLVGAGSSWMLSGDMLPNLPAGPATIEFQPVSGYLTPPNQALDVFPGQGTATRATYHPIPTNSTWAFTPLSPDTASTRHITKAPFRYLGTIDSPLGTFTGVAIAQYTVLTTLRAIYDFENNRVIPNITWSWAHDASFGIHPPLTPAGYVFLTDVMDLNTPPNPENQIVAVYFRTPVANGGHSGHHPYLEAIRKAVFAGYRVTSQNPVLVSTAEIPLPSTYSSVLFSIPNLHLADGLVGAPLLTRRSDNSCYPAALHLGGSQFRLIDDSIKNLIGVAEEAALRGKGGTFSEGKRIGSEYGIGSPRFGKIRTTITNPTGAQWKLKTDATYRDSEQEIEAAVGSQIIEFDTVTNFDKPADVNITVLEGVTVELRAAYSSLAATWHGNAFTAAQILAGKTGPHEDFDGDGIPNLLEWAFGFKPTEKDTWQPAASSPPSMPAVTRQTAEPSPKLTIRFLRRKAANGVTYRAQFSSTLEGQWSTPSSPANVSVESLDAEWERVTVVDTVPMADATSRFARVAIEEPAP